MTLDQQAVVKLDLPATYKYLNVLSGCIAEIMTHVDGIDDREAMVYNLQLAAHEICTNIVGHAYLDKGTGRIEVALSLTEQPRQLVIELEDHGRSFDPAVVPAPSLDQPQVHGYGLFIVQSLMDEVDYRPRSEGNHWRLVKYL